MLIDSCNVFNFQELFYFLHAFMQFRYCYLSDFDLSKDIVKRILFICMVSYIQFAFCFIVLICSLWSIFSLAIFSWFGILSVWLGLVNFELQCRIIWVRNYLWKFNIRSWGLLLNLVAFQRRVFQSLDWKTREWLLVIWDPLEGGG